MHLRGDLLFSQVKECGLSSVSLLIRGQRSDKNCLLRNKVGEEEEVAGKPPDDRRGGRGRQRRSTVVDVSTLLVLIGVHRKEFDK